MLRSQVPLYSNDTMLMRLYFGVANGDDISPVFPIVP